MEVGVTNHQFSFLDISKQLEIVWTHKFTWPCYRINLEKNTCSEHVAHIKFNLHRIVIAQRVCHGIYDLVVAGSIQPLDTIFLIDFGFSSLHSCLFRTRLNVYPSIFIYEPVSPPPPPNTHLPLRNRFERNLYSGYVFHINHALWSYVVAQCVRHGISVPKVASSILP